MPIFTSDHVTNQDAKHCHYSSQYEKKKKEITWGKVKTKTVNTIHTPCNTRRWPKNNSDCREA